MISKLLKICRCPCNKRNAHEDEYSVIASVHAEQDNSDTTSAATGQAVHTNDDVPPDQHHSAISRWKKVSWNATKGTLELMNQVSGPFPPIQTVAALLLDVVNGYEVRYSALSCHSRIYSSKLTSANEDSIQSVVKRLQYLNDSIVEHGTDSGAPRELERQKRLKSSVSLISCIFPCYLIFDHPVD
jgi:hypothetical protein